MSHPSLIPSFFSRLTLPASLSVMSLLFLSLIAPRCACRLHSLHPFHSLLNLLCLLVKQRLHYPTHVVSRRFVPMYLSFPLNQRNTPLCILAVTLHGRHLCFFFIFIFSTESRCRRRLLCVFHLTRERSLAPEAMIIFCIECASRVTRKSPRGGLFFRAFLFTCR